MASASDPIDAVLIAGAPSLGARASARRPAEDARRLPVMQQVAGASTIRAAAREQLDGPTCLHHVFEASVDAFPSSIALECAGERWTYAALDAETNRIARHLFDLGVRRGHLIGICLDRSHWPIVMVLAVLKVGAGYVPLEPSLPDDRLTYISDAASLKLVVTEQPYRDRLSTLCRRAKIATIQEIAISSRHSSPRRLDDALTGVRPDDVSYVLFTSGTTGRPKGVVTEHRNVVHFIHAFNAVCTTSARDRVFQGFALGFDGSVEEMWMAFSNGATLVCGDKSTPRFGPDLSALLDNLGITFLSTVPTMLSTLSPGLPRLRQLVVSGEACHPDLVDRWCRPGLVMLNVYGPTEATVNTTAAILERGRKVTIGKPLPGYDVFILDTDLKPVPDGEREKLYVGGGGISRGYLGQPSLTAKSYIEWPAPPHLRDARGGPVRLYKTGDLVSRTRDGEIDFHGRIDTQVKLRGFRIELSEIEAVLMEDPGVAAAVVNVHGKGDHQSIAAYVVPAGMPAALDRSRLMEAVRARLPVYMVPATLDVLECFPLLVSGKVDRARLPEPTRTQLGDGAGTISYAGALERQVAAIWSKVLQLPEVGPDQNLFIDLGGHSLKAAQLATELRAELGLAVPIRTIYSNPTVRSLVAALNHTPARKQLQQRAAEQSNASTVLERAKRRPWTTNAAQLLYLLAVVPLLALPLVWIIPLGVRALRQQTSVAELSAVAVAVALGTWAVLILVAIAAKWLLIGRYRPGRYPLWGGFYVRWWIVSRLQHLSGIGAFNGTPMAPVIWRLMGAKVGDRCVLNPALVYAWDCVSVGWDVSIGADTHMPGLRVDDGWLVVGTVEIGDGCFIGCHAMLGLDVRMEPGAKLDDQSLLADGLILERDVSYRGSPAKPAAIALPDGTVRRVGLGWLTIFGFLQMAAGLAVVVLTAMPMITTGWALALVAAHWPAILAVPALIVAIPACIFVFALWAAFCKRVLAPAPRPGTYEVYSIAYLRYWLSTVVMQVIKTLGLSVFTTMYLPPWMRLLGARLGRHTEMSTVWSIEPSLLRTGEGVFFADGCMLGNSRIHQGRFILAMNDIGNRSFIGNSAILPTGVNVGNDCLIGVLSSPPDGLDRLPDNTDWLGSPAFRLPHRDKVTCFSTEQTFDPSLSLRAQRAAIDGLRILLPGYVLGGFGMVAVWATLAVYDSYGVWGAYTAVPLMTWLLLVACIGTVAGLKWLIMGRFEPTVVPLWCRYVWWNELINGIYESLLAPIITNFFGTPIAPALLRAMGCRIGRYCYVETALFSEFDLVEIGDGVALNAGVVMQNHLFEDRVMKSSHLRIHDGVSVGNMSVVLYDTVMETDARLGPLSLLMKGETMPAGAHWRGIPTVEVGPATG